MIKEKKPVRNEQAGMLSALVAGEIIKIQCKNP